MSRRSVTPRDAHRHRHVRRRPIDGRQRARRPRLVRRRQPAAADARARSSTSPSTPATPSRRSRRWSTSAAASCSPTCRTAVESLRGNASVRVLFLDASDAALVRRFEQVRRPHPLQGDGTLLDGITAERDRMSELRSQSDVVIDTTDLNIHQLATRRRRAVRRGSRAPAIRLTVLSFGFKYGLPAGRRHGRRLPLPAESVLDARARAAHRARGRGARLRARRSPGPRSSSTATRTPSRRCSPGTVGRTRDTLRSPWDARAASTAPSPSPRSSVAGCASSPA